VDADAGIFHRELGDVVAIAHLEAHAARSGELDGVGEKIDEDLTQPRRCSASIPMQQQYFLPAIAPSRSSVPSQERYDLGPLDWTPIDASGPFEETLARVVDLV
jgi:hypothetical protein